MILAVGVSKESTPNMSACTACKWISSLPVFCRNAFIKGPQVRSGKKRWDWIVRVLAHGAGAVAKHCLLYPDPHVSSIIVDVALHLNHL